MRQRGFIHNTMIVLILCLLVTGGVVFALITGSRSRSTDTKNLAQHNVPPPAPASASEPETAQIPATKRIIAKDIPGRAHAFRFAATIPASWAAEAVPESSAINIYDPLAEGKTNQDKSQIFIKYFRATTFLTLSSVDVLERAPHTIRARPAVTYLIEKKSGVANFPGQPGWRNSRHRVTDIRESDANPATFYVFAQRPGLSNDVFNAFLQSLSFGDETSALWYPMTDFLTGAVASEKPFGIFVSPENSPIQPERFTGYHTGVDVTPTRSSANQAIPIFAIANGAVVFSQSAPGYGGVLAIRHLINDKQILAVYGHLDPRSLARNNRPVHGGERIGFLGKAFSAETDFERQHLHFGLYRGGDINIRGYVKNKSDLAQWLDPVAFFKSAVAKPYIPAAM